jgi:pilus assembly protein CpaC
METPKSPPGIFRACRLAPLAILIVFAGCVSAARAQQSPVPGIQIQAPAPRTAAPMTPPTAIVPDNPDQTVEMPQALHLLVGRSLVISSPTRIKRTSLADPGIAQAVVVSPTQVVLSGVAPGGTSFILWDESELNQNFEVSVDIDIQSLSQKIRAAFPTEPVQLEASKDIVMLSGKISSAAAAEKILEIVKNATPKVVSMMEIPVVPVGDILLEVKFAEVDRTAITQLGINLLSLPGSKNIGTTSTGQFAPPSLVTGQTATTTGPVGQLTSTFGLSDLLNIFIFRPDINLAATIKALQAKDILQILAEPNLLTASGKEANFLAGGEFPYPVLQGTAVGGSQGITIQFKEFGVRLSFTPTLMVDGSIHLKVKPEVSALDFANSVTISGFTIPALSTRRVESEMDLKDGQSFAIAGLVDNRVTEQLSKVPGLGDIPLLGKLFQSKSLNKSHNELLVLVTPRVVHGLDPGKVPPGPTFPIPFIGPAPPEQPKAPIKQ